jgi:hypothetical protein
MFHCSRLCWITQALYTQFTTNWNMSLYSSFFWFWLFSFSAVTCAFHICFVVLSFHLSYFFWKPGNFINQENKGLHWGAWLPSQAASVWISSLTSTGAWKRITAPSCRNRPRRASLWATLLASLFTYWNLHAGKSLPVAIISEMIPAHIDRFVPSEPRSLMREEQSVSA